MSSHQISMSQNPLAFRAPVEKKHVSGSTPYTECKKNPYNKNGSTRVCIHIYTYCLVPSSLLVISLVSSCQPCITSPMSSTRTLQIGPIGLLVYPGRCTQTAYQSITLAPRPTHNIINHQSNEANNIISEPTNI